MEERHDPMEWKYDPMEERYDPMKWKYDRMEERYDPMEWKYDPMEERYDPMEWKYDPMEERYDPMEWKYDPVEHGYDPMECKGRLDCIFVQNAPPYKSTETILERCFSCQNKSVCQKLARSCKKMKISQKCDIRPFCTKPFNYV